MISNINNKVQLAIHRGDIVYVDFGDGVGSEQGGLRPAAVIQNDIGNKYAPTTIVAPLTSQMDKKRLPTHILVEPAETGLAKPSVILFEQVRTIDKCRIKEKVGRLDNHIINKIDRLLMISFGMTPDRPVYQMNAVAMA